MESCLNNLLHDYNFKRVHSTIKFVSIDVFIINKDDINYQELIEKINFNWDKRNKYVKPGIKIGDYVLISIFFVKTNKKLIFKKESKRGGLRLRIIPGLTFNVDNINSIKIRILKNFETLNLRLNEEIFVDIKLLRIVNKMIVDNFINNEIDLNIALINFQKIKFILIQ